MGSTANIQKFESIEGLRGLLAVMVCFGHYGLGQLFETCGLAFRFHFAVDLFFVISGFVLAYSNFYAPKPVSTSYYVLKRFARLYPLHLLTLCVMVALLMVSDQGIAWSSAVQNGLLLQNIGFAPMDNALNFPSWSIAVEFWISLLLFFLCRFVRSISLLMVGLVGVIAAISLLVPHMILHGDYEGIYHGMNAGVLRAIAGMALGVLVYLTYQKPVVVKCLAQQPWGYIAALALIGYGFSPWALQSAALFYLLVFVLVSQMAIKPDFLKLLSLKTMVWLGSISYAIYLLHIPLYALFKAGFGDIAVKGWLGKACLLPTLFCVAVLSYRYFERPCQRWIRGWGLRRQVVSTSAVS